MELLLPASECARGASRFIKRRRRGYKFMKVLDWVIIFSHQVRFAPKKKLPPPPPR